MQAIAWQAEVEITLATYARTNLDQMCEAVDLIDWQDPTEDDQ